MTTKDLSHSKSTTPQKNKTASQKGCAFSSNQGIHLPIEVWYMVRENMSKAETRVTLCLLFNYFQTGVDAQPLSFTDIVKQTKLSKSSALAGIEAAIERGSVSRTSVGNQPRYEPRFGKNRTHVMESLKIHGNNDSSKHGYKPCHGSENRTRQEFFERLLSFGLAFHVAENITMTNRYPLEQLKEQMAFIEFEKKHDLLPQRQSSIPGYIVNRIKFNKIAPASYTDNDLDDLWIR